MKQSKEIFDKNKYVDTIINQLILLIILLILIGALLFYNLNTLDTPQDVAKIVADLGFMGPILIILLIVLEVIVAPIPGILLTIASGYAFGGFFGSIYSYIGNILGSILAFSLSRHFGRPFIKAFVNQKKLDLYNSFFKEKGMTFVWIAFLFPIFPVDVISFMLGLTEIKLKKFASLISIAYIPYIIITNYYGANLFEYGFSANTIMFTTSILFLVVLASAIYYHMTKKKNRKSKRELHLL